MGKSSSQVVGYRYYAKFAAFIGNRIEKLIAINFDNRKWIIHDPLKHPPNLLPVLDNNLFGENEGGVSGNVDIHFGTPDQEPNAEYQKYFPLVSGYPYQSYLIFRGLTTILPFVNKEVTAPGFYLGNSGYMKEMLLWVKRTRVRNDGRKQWYEVGGGGAVVCEMGGINIDASTLITDAVTGRHTVTIRTRIEGSTAQPSYPEYTESYNFPLISAGLNYSDRDATSIKITVGDGFLPGIYQFLGYVQYTTSNDLQPIDVVGGSIVEFESEKVGNTRFDFDIKAFVEGEFGLSFSLPKRGAIVNFSIIQVQKGIFFLNTEGSDINPIHKIREILTDDTAMGKPETDVNDINFMKAADRIWKEKLGISWAIDEKSCVEAIEELCYHIEAGIRVNRQTGLYEMVLFRDDWFIENEIHDIAENKIKDLSLEVMNSDDIVNQLNVTYYDRDRIKNSAFSVYENGSILTMGHANAESVEFPYFMNMRNAEIVANWKLKQFSTPAWSGSFSTGWREARKWNRYDLIRLPWSKKWNGTILARIMKINLGNGTDNTVTIDFEEVIPYSGEMNTSIVVDAPVETAPQPPQPSANAIFEAPYYLTVLRAGQTNADLELSNNPAIGYVAAIAAKPQSNSLNALLYTDGGVGEFEQVSRLDYCDILQLDQPIAETSSSFTVTGSLTQVANSNNLILLNDELMGFVSFDDETKVLTVKRGVLDTVPKKHSSGSLFVFDLPDIAFDSTQYTQSEVVKAQVLTTTPSGVQELTVGTEVEIQARAIRPYPAANVKINDEYWPDDVTGDLVLTWNHRNRLQQTGGIPVGWYESGITKENDVKYAVEVYDNQTNTLLDSMTDINADNVTIASSVFEYENRIELYAVRETYESYQRFIHVFTHGVQRWNPSSLITQARMWLDGSSINRVSNRVESWIDKINAHTFAQTVTSLQPLYVGNAIANHPAIRFDGVDDYLQTSASLHLFKNTGKVWMLSVFKPNAIQNTSNQTVFATKVGTSQANRFALFASASAVSPANRVGLNIRRLDTDSAYSLNSDNSIGTSPTIALISIDYVAQKAEVIVNGVVKSAIGILTSGVTSNTDAFYGHLIGAERPNLGFFSGDVAEIIMGTGDLPTPAEIDKLFGWAAHKYGLVDSLPLDHPYKLREPTVED